MWLFHRAKEKRTHEGACVNSGLLVDDNVVFSEKLRIQRAKNVSPS